MNRTKFAMLDEAEVAERHYANESIYSPDATLDEKISCIMQKKELYELCRNEIGEDLMNEGIEKIGDYILDTIKYESDNTHAFKTINKYYQKLLER